MMHVKEKKKTIKTRKLENILMRKHLTSHSKQSVKGKEKHSSIGICFRSRRLICLTYWKKREKENPLFFLSVTYVRVSANRKYKLIFLFFLSAIHVCIHNRVWMIFVDREYILVYDFAYQSCNMGEK